MMATRALALVLLAAGPVSVAPLRTARWQEVFAVDGGPAVHARARYRDARGGEHLLELWRSKRAVRRDTDGKLTVVVTHSPGLEDRYRVIDRERGRSFDATRTSLQHIGVFPEWAQMTSLLTCPSGDVVVATMARQPEHGPVGDCRWYEVGGSKPTSRICWSARLKLPLLVERPAGEGWTPVITVESVRLADVRAMDFTPADDGAVQIDLDADLD